MHLMGLHGKSFLPLFLGFGCNVPAVMGTRVIESWPARSDDSDRAAGALHGAHGRGRFFGAGFLWRQRRVGFMGLVLLTLVILVASGALLNLVLFKGERSAFIMEMPLYHLPNWRTIGLLVWQRVLSFVHKAGNTILAISVVIWALSVLPGGELETSFLAQFGRLLEPLGRWMGLDWRLMVALITTFPSQRKRYRHPGRAFGQRPAGRTGQSVAAEFSTASGLSFLVVTMLFVPCLATVARHPPGDELVRWTLLNLAMLLVISIAGGSLVYHLPWRWGCKHAATTVIHNPL